MGAGDGPLLLARREGTAVPYYSIYALDKDGMAETRAANRPDHRERLRSHDHPVQVHIGGPLLNDVGGMIGTLLIVEADGIEDVRRFVEGDPYNAAGVYASVEIRPFHWGLGLPEEKE